MGWWTRHSAAMPSAPDRQMAARGSGHGGGHRVVTGLCAHVGYAISRRPAAGHGETAMRSELAIVSGWVGRDQTCWPAEVLDLR